MSLTRVPFLLAGFLGGFGAVLTLDLTEWSLGLTSPGAAISLTGILLGVLGLMLSTLTAIAGALVIADGRADVDAARAWRDINAEVTQIGTQAEMAPASPFDTRYVVGPQDEGLRRIMLAHRFDVPLPAPKGTARSAPACVGATDNAGPDCACIDKEPTTTAKALMAAVVPLEEAASPEQTFRQSAPSLIVGKPDRRDQSIDLRGMRQPHLRSSMRATTKVRLVANAGRSWHWPERGTIASHGGPAIGFAVNVIFLAADRKSSDRNHALPDAAVDATEPAQPGCRGPPTGRADSRAAAEPASGKGTSGKRHRPRTDVLIAPADHFVIDDLGDRLPIGAAELQVVETYLDDVLRDLLATAASGKDRRES